jgi:hypothetical protein
VKTVVHQDVGEECEPALGGHAGQAAQEVDAVTIVEEDRSPFRAAGNHMVSSPLKKPGRLSSATA